MKDASASEFIAYLQIEIVVAREVPELTPRFAAVKVGADRAPDPIGEAVTQRWIHKVVAVAGLAGRVDGQA
ncbi:MAG: hypothetical protein NTV11_19965 [Rhodocyclales bacterium]|nr:hypothetical protein [Rhodocyclales bacterium]